MKQRALVQGAATGIVVTQQHLFGLQDCLVQTWAGYPVVVPLGGGLQTVADQLLQVTPAMQEGDCDGVCILIVSLA
ncbi:hypothetical protein D3C81_2154040 [compost metagenome]